MVWVYISSVISYSNAEWEKLSILLNLLLPKLPAPQEADFAKGILEDIAPKVAADVAFQNAKANTPHTAGLAHDQALAKVMQHLLTDDTQVYRQFVENESFKRFVGDMEYAITNP